MKTKPAIMLMICILIFAGISGCISSSSPADNKTPTAQPSSSPTAAPTAAPTVTPTLAPEPAPISVSGSGSQQALKIHLEQGLSVFTINHPGNGNFQIWLADKTRKLDLLVSRSSGYYGSKAEQILAPDDYYLVINADGAWTVNVDQPRPAYAPSVPVSFSGTGKQVSQFFTLNPVETTFKMTHDGWSNFDVWLLDINGARVGHVADAVSPYDGSSTINVTRSGVYLLDIQADGHWNIDISQ